MLVLFAIGQDYSNTYDTAANACREIPQTNSFIDGNGYLHFNTSVGNDIIVSQGELTLR